MNRLPPLDGPWLATVPADSAEALGAARLCPGIEVAAESVEGILWLRGPGLTEEIVRALRGAGGLEWREPVPGGYWKKAGDRLPGGALPPEIRETDWHSLRESLVPDLPPLEVAEPVSQKAVLRVIPSAVEHTANVLFTTIGDLSAWAVSAPEVRLHPLRFAVRQDGRAVVHGTPLPPVPGEVWWEAGGVAVPGGMEIDPPVPPSLIRDLCGLPSEWKGLILIHPPGSVEMLPEEVLAGLNRASARMSSALHNGAPPEGGIP